jgi:hypothetical protein
MLNLVVPLWVLICLMTALPLPASEDKISDATLECLECHGSIHPGIVEGWRQSRHARVTPRDALAVKGPGLKVSSPAVPEALLDTAVGCAECHNLRPDAHADTFDHNGHAVHVVVSPKDCAVCHSEEAAQFSQNIMAHAVKNLAENPVYQMLQRSILGKPVHRDGRVIYEPEDEATRADGCYYCHGTVLEVTGTETRDTDLGEMVFPRIAGWPNQGVGRINLDGSLGSCAACHTRHTFSIEMARKPHTCKECHVGPDVPAYKVYSASKHGNIYEALHKGWDFKSVPWTVGKDFTAPTCAACHISLLVNTDGDIINKRTHQVSDRLSWRIFGLIYAHPQPKSPDTTVIRNSAGLHLPTDFDGGFASDYLIDEKEQARRQTAMQATCLSCHDRSWVRSHWTKYEHVIGETNASTRTATDLMAKIWASGAAEGLEKNQNPFDEAAERTWSDVWLFYANTVRFASAMAGGGDYGVFADGRYYLTRRIAELGERLRRREKVPATGE